MKRYAPCLSFLKDLALGVLLYLLITTFVGEARVVPSGSMMPTIQIGDRFWTDKLLLHFRPIERGDIVVFTPPPAAHAETKDPFIKRVIGLPGDHIEVTHGQVIVNGQPLTEPYIAQKPNYSYGPVTVPPGKYVVFGDNRNDSEDSHYWGFLPQSAIISRAVFRMWPVGRIGLIK